MLSISDIKAKSFHIDTFLIALVEDLNKIKKTLVYLEKIKHEGDILLLVDYKIHAPKDLIKEMLEKNISIKKILELIEILSIYHIHVKNLYNSLIKVKDFYETLLNIVSIIKEEKNSEIFNYNELLKTNPTLKTFLAEDELQKHFENVEKVFDNLYGMNLRKSLHKPAYTIVFILDEETYKEQIDTELIKIHILGGISNVEKNRQ